MVKVSQINCFQSSGRGIKKTLCFFFPFSDGCAQITSNIPATGRDSASSAGLELRSSAWRVVSQGTTSNLLPSLFDARVSHYYSDSTIKCNLSYCNFWKHCFQTWICLKETVHLHIFFPKRDHYSFMWQHVGLVLRYVMSIQWRGVEINWWVRLNYFLPK